MKLLIIRHDESEADILDVHEGRADFELTDRGHNQAEIMSEFVNQHYHFDMSKIISENDESSTVAVVTHGGMINQLYRSFLRLPVDSEFHFYTGDTGIHEWMINGNSRSVIRANYILHQL